MARIEKARTWARRIERDGVTLWFAGKHLAAPWYVLVLGAWLAVCTAAWFEFRGAGPA